MGDAGDERDAMARALRLAVAGDREQVVALVQAAYAMYVERMGQQPAPMLADYGALIERGVVWVMAGEGRLRGVIVMWPEGDHLFLENVAVHPDDQGQGIGRRLLAFADERARALELGAVELYTNEAMTENLAFYPRLGFAEYDRRTEDGYRRVYMRKRLT